MDKEQENKMLIKHLQSGIATAKGVDGDFVYITVGDAKRILKAFGVEEETVENGYLGMILKALECQTGKVEEKPCKYCHYSKKMHNDPGHVKGLMYLCDQQQLARDTINLLLFYADELRKEREKNGQ